MTVALVLLVLVAVAAVLVAILAGISAATPGGLTPRTMDSAASWRA